MNQRSCPNGVSDGVANPQPAIRSQAAQVRDVRTVGNKGNHLRLVIRDGRGAIWDTRASRRGNVAGQVSSPVDVAYALEINRWNGGHRLQLDVQDLEASL